MTYEKPTITFKKFHTDAFLADTGILSGMNNTEHEEDVWDPNAGFEFGSNEFNGFISLDGDGVGGWFNG